MSPLEVRDANLKDEPFQYEFFGTPDHLFSKTDPRDFYPYRPADFSSVFEVEWGNNELTRDASNRQFLFVPTPIRQLISNFGRRASDLPLSQRRAPDCRQVSDHQNCFLSHGFIVLDWQLCVPRVLPGCRNEAVFLAAGSCWVGTCWVGTYRHARDCFRISGTYDSGLRPAGS